VRKLRLELEPWRDSQTVKNFDEQLREVDAQYRPWITYCFGYGIQEVSQQAGSAERDRDRRRTGTCRATGNNCQVGYQRCGQVGRPGWV
jgi:hypothetical protein